MDIIQLIVIAFSALVGFPAFLTALANLLVFLKVPLNTESFYFWANVAGFVAVGFFVFTGRTDILSTIDASLVGLAKILVDALILLGGTATSLFFNYRMDGKVRTLNVRNLRA